MIFLDELKDLVLYKKPFWLPINEENKRYGSVIYLLTPNYESSRELMNMPFIINNNLYQSYFMDKNISFLISNENATVIESQPYLHAVSEGIKNVTAYYIDEKDDMDGKTMDENLTCIDITSCIRASNLADGKYYVYALDYMNRLYKYGKIQVSTSDIQKVSKWDWSCKYPLPDDFIPYGSTVAEANIKYMSDIAVQKISDTLVSEITNKAKEYGISDYFIIIEGITLSNYHTSNAVKYIRESYNWWGHERHANEDWKDYEYIIESNNPSNKEEFIKFLKELFVLHNTNEYFCLVENDVISKNTSDNPTIDFIEAEYNDWILSGKENTHNDQRVTSESVLNKLGFQDDDFKDITTFNRALKDLETKNTDEVKYGKVLDQLIRSSAKIMLGPGLSTAAALSSTVASLINIIIKDESISDEIKYTKLCNIRKKLNRSIQATKLLLRITKDQAKKKELNDKIYSMEKSVNKLTDKIDIMDATYKAKIENTNMSSRYDLIDESTFQQILDLCDSGYLDEDVNVTLDNTPHWSQNKDQFFNGKSNVLFITGPSTNGKSTLAKSISKSLAKCEHIRMDIVDYIDTSMSDILKKNAECMVSETLIKLAYDESVNFVGSSIKANTVRFVVNYVLKEAREHPEKKYIMESLYLSQILEDISGYPIIIPTPDYLHSCCNFIKRVGIVNEHALSLYEHEDIVNMIKYRDNSDRDVMIEKLTELRNGYKSYILESTNYDKKYTLSDWKADLFHFDKFMDTTPSNTNNILFVVGSTYSDKERLCRILAEKTNANYINLDIEYAYDKKSLNETIHKFLSRNDTKTKLILSSKFFNEDTEGINYNPLVLLKPISMEETLDNIALKNNITINESNIDNNILLAAQDRSVSYSLYESIAKQNKIYVKSISMVICDDRGRILLQKHVASGTITLPGGKCEGEENPLLTVKREAKEELGINIISARMLYEREFEYTYNDRPGIYHTIDKTYFIDKYDGEIKNMEPKKCGGFIWVDPYMINPNDPKYGSNAQNAGKYFRELRVKHKSLRKRKNIEYYGYSGDVKPVIEVINQHSIMMAYRKFHGRYPGDKEIAVIVQSDINGDDYIDHNMIKVLSKSSYTLHFESNYIQYLQSAMYVHVIKSINPNIHNGLAYAIAEDYSGIYDFELSNNPTEYPLIYLMRLIRIKEGDQEVARIILQNNIKDVQRYAQAYGIKEINKNLDSLLEADEPITNVQTLTRRIKRSGRKASVYKLNKISRHVERTLDPNQATPEIKDADGNKITTTNFINTKSTAPVPQIKTEAANEECNTPQELLTYLNNNFNYGFVVNGRIATKDEEDNIENYYKPLSRTNFEKYRIGTCYDYVNYEAYWFKSHGYIFDTYFIQMDCNPDYPTHTFLVYKENGKYYYFEAAWYSMKGIWEFNNLNELFGFVLTNEFQIYANDKEIPYDLFKYIANDTLANIPCNQFIDKVLDTGTRVNYKYQRYTKDPINIFTEAISLMSGPDYKTPQELMEFFNQCTYGFTVDGRQSTDDELKEIKKLYKAPLHTKMESNKYGICWDYTTYASYWFSSHGYEFQTYLIKLNNPPKYKYTAHSILVYKENNMYYYFEASWLKETEIWQFLNLTDLFNFVLTRMFKKHTNGKEISYDIIEYPASDTKFAGLYFDEYVDTVYEIGEKVKHKYDMNFTNGKLIYQGEHSSFEENTNISKLYLLRALSESEYIATDEALILTTEADKTNTILKRTLYQDRIRQDKEVLNLYDRVLAENPFIKYAYINLNRYKGRNLFFDLSYYNESFFRNSMYKNKRGYKLYLELMKRQIVDRELPEKYKKKTVFIPVCDWDLNPETNMWIYRDDINPISIIYGLMKDSPTELINIFGNITFVFISPVNYFKMRFTKDTVSTTGRNKFISLIKILRAKGINGSSEPDPEDTPKESPKSIAMNILNKIEKSKGIQINKFSNNKLTTAVMDDEDITDFEDSDEESEVDELVDTIQTVANTAYDTDDAIEQMDDERIKNMINTLADDSPNTPQMNKARVARFNKMDENLKKSTINNKSIGEILDANPKEAFELEEMNIPVSSINDDWHHMKFVTFDGNPEDIRDDIIRAVYSFSEKTYQVHIRDFDIEDVSTSEDWIHLYTFEMEDFNGTRFTLKFEIPIMIESEMKLRGNKKTINMQSFLMPIVKTDTNVCQLVSNYKKIFVRTFGNTPGKSNVVADRIIKTANKYIEANHKKIKFVTGDASVICPLFELPIDYIDLASVFDRIETPDYIIYFNQNSIREEHEGVDPKKGVPFAYEKSNKQIIYFNTGIHASNEFATISDHIYAMLDIADKEFAEIAKGVKNSIKYMYTKASVMSAEIPLIVVCAFSVGLTSVLNKAKIKYDITEKLESSKRNSIYDSWIRFTDGYLVYENDYASTLLLNGLKDCDTESYSIHDIDKKVMWYNFLDQFGGRIKADGLDNFYDCMIDPITKGTLERFDLPTDYIDLLLYSNLMLIDNRYERHVEIGNRRLRRGELIAAYTYNVLAESYGVYANQIRHGRGKPTMTVKRSAIIDKILSDPTSSDSSCINALNALETKNTVSTKGISGMNADRAYGLAERSYDDSMLNVFGMSTGFAGNVGITRQATIDASIEGARGFIIGAGGDVSKLCTTKTLTATEAMTPFGSTRDDPFRTAMTFIQTAKHQLRTEKSDPLLVTYGMDEALPYMTTSLFCQKARDNGEVVELNDEYMIVQYKDGTADMVNLLEAPEKNSDGGYFTPMQKKTDLKLGAKVKKGEIIAYDKYSFSNNLGETDNLAYNAGTLMKVAILNTDEGFEDSACITTKLAKDMATEIVYPVVRFLPKETNVYQIGSVGQHVEEGDTILTFQTPYDQEDVNTLLKNLVGDDEDISELGRIPVKSKVTGMIEAIRIYRTVEIEELSESLQKIVKQYESEITKTEKIMKKYNIPTRDLPANYKLPCTGKLKNAEGGVLIEFYLKYQDLMAVGDKLVYFSANKGVVKYIIPEGLEPYTASRPEEKIDAFIALRSINARMVTSIPNYGAGAKLMVELDRSCKDLAGIPYSFDEL